MRWCNRSLVFSPIYYGLCLTEKEFHKELKRLKCPKEQWPPFIKNEQSDATVHWIQSDNGKLSGIVCIRDRSDIEEIQYYSMLVHEAVHIWQEIRAYIGEDSPSREFEAYSIQAISQELMYSYKEQKEKNNARGDSTI